MAAVGPGALIDRLKERIDRFQQEHRPLAFVAAVAKKFSDDRAGDLAAVVTYYAFLSVFPMLLLFLTVTGFVLHDAPGLRADLVDSAFAEFPVVGSQLRRNIDTLDGNGVALAIGIFGLLWGSLGAAKALQTAMAEVWDIAVHDRPGFAARLARALLLLVVLGVAVVTTTTATALVAQVSGSVLVPLGSLLATLAVNVGCYFLGFRVLTPAHVPNGHLWRGAVVGAVAWTVLQLVGGWLVASQLRNASELYGFFGIVLGLLFFFFLAARLSLYAAEVNVVHARGLFPRSLWSDAVGVTPRPRS